MKFERDFDGNGKQVAIAIAGAGATHLKTEVQLISIERSEKCRSLWNVLCVSVMAILISGCPSQLSLPQGIDNPQQTSGAEIDAEASKSIPLDSEEKSLPTKPLAEQVPQVEQNPAAEDRPVEATSSPAIPVPADSTSSSFATLPASDVQRDESTRIREVGRLLEAANVKTQENDDAAAFRLTKDAWDLIYSCESDAGQKQASEVRAALEALAKRISSKRQTAPPLSRTLKLK